MFKRTRDCVLKEHEWLESTEYWLNFKQRTQAAEPTGVAEGWPRKTRDLKEHEIMGWNEHESNESTSKFAEECDAVA